VDPEQIYEEVLKEEQGKGVSPAVAEGRAKAARARAEAGSPHPKEPKWWTGAQPHLEGGEGEAEAPVEEEAPAAAAEEAAPEPEPAAEEPAAEEPAAEEPAAPAEEEQAAPPAPEEAPAAAEAPSAEPAPAPAAEPAAQPAATAQPAAAAVAAPEEAARPVGVLHGTKTGTRLRPEDVVSTDAQFEGQQAMYERRKLIDDLVATGVPAVAAQETGRPRTPWLALLYVIIPIVVIAYLAGQESSEGTEPAPPPETTEDGGGGSDAALVASGTQWDTDTLTIPAKGAEVEVSNEDPTTHNMSIYPNEQAALDKQDPLFKGEDVQAGSSVTYEIDPLKPGTYTFICDYHTNMIGDITVE
jgi:plastocyanin